MLKDLVNSQQWEEVYLLIDLLASEYGWTIEYIQTLTVAEIAGLVHCILKRKGLLKPEQEVTTSGDPMDNLIALAKQLKAKPEQIEKLKKGEGLKI